MSFQLSAGGEDGLCPLRTSGQRPPSLSSCHRATLENLQTIPLGDQRNSPQHGVLPLQDLGRSTSPGLSTGLNRSLPRFPPGLVSEDPNISFLWSSGQKAIHTWTTSGTRRRLARELVKPVQKDLCLEVTPVTNCGLRHGFSKSQRCYYGKFQTDRKGKERAYSHLASAVITS